jgi:hypothetical protein
MTSGFLAKSSKLSLKEKNSSQKSTFLTYIKIFEKEAMTAFWLRYTYMEIWSSPLEKGWKTTF